MASLLWSRGLDFRRGWKNAKEADEWSVNFPAVCSIAHCCAGNEISITEEQRWFKEGVDVDSVEISEDHW